MRRLTALLAALLLLAFTGCAANPAQPESTSSPAQADETQADFQVESAYPLEYAKEFTVDECTGGTRLITIQNARYLVVPENSTVPNGLSEDITVLQKPLENVYLVSTSAMDPILKLDARSAVTLPARTPKTGICRKRKKPWKTVKFPTRVSTARRITSASCLQTAASRLKTQ